MGQRETIDGSQHKKESKDGSFLERRKFLSVRESSELEKERMFKTNRSKHHQDYSVIMTKCVVPGQHPVGWINGLAKEEPLKTFSQPLKGEEITPCGENRLPGKKEFVGKRQLGRETFKNTGSSGYGYDRSGTAAVRMTLQKEKSVIILETDCTGDLTLKKNTQTEKRVVTQYNSRQKEKRTFWWVKDKTASQIQLRGELVAPQTKKRTHCAKGRSKTSGGQIRKRGPYKKTY